MRDFRSTGITVAVLLLLFGGVVFAQDSTAQERAALERKMTFVRLFAKGHVDTYPQLEAEVAKFASTRNDDPQAVGLHCTVLDEYASRLRKAKNARGALERLDRIIAYGPRTGFRPAAAETAGEILLGFADSGGDDQTVLGHLEEAKKRYELSPNPARVEEITGRIVGIYTRTALVAYERKDYAVAYDQLKAATDAEIDLSSNAAASKAWKFLSQRTAVLSIDVKKVPASVPGRDVAGARVRLVPRRDGEKWEGSFFETRRWTTGDYDYVVVIAGKPALTLPVSIGSGGGIVVPSRIPDGMVFIPAGGGQRAFFIDMHEVTNAQFRKFRSSYQPEYAGEMVAAHDISWRNADAYARSQGKLLPTQVQWLRAAYGDNSGSPYPWGSGGLGRNTANLNSEEPKRVGSHPGDKSPFGVMDMAGNMSEWLADKWVIGGSFNTGNPQKDLRNVRLNYLKDKRPGPEAFQALSGARRRQFDAYKIDPEEDNTYEVGFRCVLAL